MYTGTKKVFSKRGSHIGVINDQESSPDGKCDVPGKPFVAHYFNNSLRNSGKPDGWKLGYFSNLDDAHSFIHSEHRKHLDSVYENVLHHRRELKKAESDYDDIGV